jgi:uncharacterized protein (TIRG00374 family)
MKKLIIGIVLSIVFIYFSVRGVHCGKILHSLSDMQYFYLLPAILLFLSLSILRSLRWGIILSPIKHIEQRKLFPISCVGFMSVVLFPMRVGELMRPWVISTKQLAPFSSVLATVVVERVFDTLTILGVFLIVMMNSSLPPWLIRSGYIAFTAFVVMILFICVLYFRTETTLKFLMPVVKILPHGFRTKLEDLIHNFIDGFRIIASPGRLFYTLMLSILIWVISGLAVYVLFFLHNIHLPPIVAFIVLVGTIIGVSLPTAPGMLGNFQFACVLVLTMFGLPKDDAFVFSMVYYFVGIGMVIIMGLVFLPFTDFSLRYAFNKLKQSRWNS